MGAGLKEFSYIVFVFGP